MGRRATDVNHLTFSVAKVLQKETGALGQVPTVGCQPGGLRMHVWFKWIKLGLPAAGSKQSLDSHSKDSQLVSPKSNKIASLFIVISQWCKMEVERVGTRMTEEFMPSSHENLVQFVPRPQLKKHGNLLLKTGSGSALSESGAISQKVIVQSCIT